jgi:hypothetical protein
MSAAVTMVKPTVVQYFQQVCMIAVDFGVLVLALFVLLLVLLLLVMLLLLLLLGVIVGEFGIGVKGVG